MSKSLIVAGLEIGTSRTVLCAGEQGEQGKVNIIGTGTYPTTGVRKGQIVDMEQVQVCIKRAVEQLEESTNINVWHVLVAVSGGHIHSKVNPGVLSIGDADITQEDVQDVTELANNVKIEDGRVLLHTIRQSFKVDDQPGIIRPVGMRCKVLQLDILAIDALQNRLDNMMNAVHKCQLEVSDTVFGGICAAIATLTPQQKSNGVVMIDLGGGTTNYVAFRENVIAAAGSIALGGDHVTNDIALAFKIAHNHAEEIKRSEGSALVDQESNGERVNLPVDKGFAPRSISRKSLHTVINARMDELFRLLRDILGEQDVLPNLGGGVVLCGGGAYLKKVKDLAQNVFGIPCTIATLQNVTGVEGLEQPASFATAVGLVQYGLRNEADKGKKGIMEMVKGWFKK
ncbi:MAG: cell division protein FtsA [Kiritimatiellae bacterium]|nr:cell division protein FtsA [Kiritimatiellia bacterium]